MNVSFCGDGDDRVTFVFDRVNHSFDVVVSEGVEMSQAASIIFQALKDAWPHLFGEKIENEDAH